MKTLLKFLLFILLIGFSSCDKKSIKDNLDITEDPAEKSLVLDSIILLSNFYNYKIDGEHPGGNALTHVSAKAMIDKHFQKQGYLIMKNIPKNTEEVNNKNFCLFDTMYHFDLNNNMYLDAIVVYKLYIPKNKNNCLSNRNLLIMDTKEGYKIVKENFLPCNFHIDSVDLGLNSTPIIYGYDFNSVHNKIKRYFKLKIK
jgi:hypothetical protein